MREIKFRAWSKIEKQHYWVDIIDWKSKKVNLVGGPIAKFSEVILEQFTGLHDNNGVEIYEGDILKSNQYSYLFVVKFGDHGYSAYTDCVELGFYAHCTDEMERNRGIREDLPFWVREAESQVVGNIHDQEEAHNEAEN